MVRKRPANPERSDCRATPTPEKTDSPVANTRLTREELFTKRLSRTRLLCALNSHQLSGPRWFLMLLDRGKIVLFYAGSFFPGPVGAEF